jgi:hypothetical protein
MIKKIIYFPDQQVKSIQKDADSHEISFTEMVRRIIDRYYEERDKEKGTCQ